MISRRKAPKAGIRKPAQLRSPAHLQWVRGHVCAVDTDQCQGGIEAAHVRLGTDGGMAVKPSDNYVIPLCHYHHDQQHRLGEKSFAMLQFIDPLKIANELASRSPALAKLRHEEN